MEKRKTEEKREEDGKEEDVTEIASFLNFQRQSRNELGVCLDCMCVHVCVYTPLFMSHSPKLCV